MPAYMPNIHCAKFYVFAYVNCCIYYNARISMPVDMLSSVYLLICQMLYPICYVLYAGCHMPRLVCRFIYVEYRMLASYCEFAIIPVYMPISVPVYACSVTDLICQLQYTCIYMPAHECQISVVRCQVSLYANLGCYMSNCYLWVNMPSALFQELYVEFFVLYVKSHMPVTVYLHLYAGTWVPRLFYELSS
jgi:hypothetical protein